MRQNILLAFIYVNTLFVKLNLWYVDVIYDRLDSGY